MPKDYVTYYGLITHKGIGWFMKNHFLIFKNMKKNYCLGKSIHDVNIKKISPETIMSKVFDGKLHIYWNGKLSLQRPLNENLLRKLRNV